MREVLQDRRLPTATKLASQGLMGLEKDAEIHGVHSKEGQLDRHLCFALVFEIGSDYVAQLSLHSRQSSCLGLPLK